MKNRVLPVILVLVLAGALGTWLYFKPDASREAFASREAATRMLGQNLGQKFPGQKILAVSNPFTQKKGQLRHVYLLQEAGVSGLRKGVGADRVVVGFPELQPGALENPHAFNIPQTTTTPVAYLLAEGAFDTLAQKHAGCTVLVSLIGIPTDLTRSKTWQAADGPKFAFLLPDLWMLGDKQAVLNAFKTGKIAGVVLKKTGSAEDLKAGSSKDFTNSYLLVTPENVEESMTKYPQLFE